MAHQRTPASVAIRKQPREHVRDPSLGIEVDIDRSSSPTNRLVTLGDSITQGFMSAAVFRTDRSWPAIVAHELGLQPQVGFRYPKYEPPSGPGGLPIDLERAIRGLESVVGDRLGWHELIRAGLWAQSYLDRIEDYWEGRGDPRFQLEHPPAPYHNLAVYGADLVDVQVLTAQIIRARLENPAKDDVLNQLVERDNDRAWQVVLESCGHQSRTVIDAAKTMGDEGPGEHGIETLVVMLGANNALGTVVDLEPRWTDDDYGRQASLDDRLESKGVFNVWQPTHFAQEWDRLVEKLRTIGARHVIVATVPQVTIAPVARGVRGKARHGSRFFPHYTRPWIGDDDFDIDRDPWIDEDQARGIDSAIDAFNETIIESVRQARVDGLDWYLFDLAGLLDSMAVKRYIDDPETQPPWWVAYDLPLAVASLRPPLDTKFFASDPTGRTQGGYFSLDGVHPTTTAAGIIAREVVRIMDRHAQVEFAGADGTVRPRGSVEIDFSRVLQLDTLNREPPRSVSSTLSLLGWFDERVDWLRRLLP